MNEQKLAAGQAGLAPAEPYLVLARKYRPSRFEDLIGQEPMVRTLANAFELGRVHQAYILTGVRGVGKTTTARILARAFNYSLPGKVDLPTINMPELGVHCQAIIDSRHPDVIEMDAASHTGIDDIREIIESARYKPILARTKVFIIDEVHMLSKQAFNGLLKTLEEPPEHVKFLFATTEIEKVPVTVRSRCQRFDLRRIDTQQMIDYLRMICGRETVGIEDEALAMLARASEGSMRDSLSLLDQAIAHGAGAQAVMAAPLRLMLGVADRSQIINLFDALMRGAINEALSYLRSTYDGGADPVQILTELAEFIHFVTRVKLVAHADQDLAFTQQERESARDFAPKLSVPVLTRAWQILMKGLQELKDSPRPLASADMVLVRLAFAADLPLPQEALRRLQSSGSDAPTPSRSNAPPSGGAPRAFGSTALTLETAPAQAPSPPQMKCFADVVAHAGAMRDIRLKGALERDVRLVHFEQGRIEFSLVEGASSRILQQLTQKLQEWTGQRWLVALASGQGQTSLHEDAQAQKQVERDVIEADPLIKAALAQFPGAKIIAVHKPQPLAAPDQSIAVIDGDDLIYEDQSLNEDF